MSNLLLKDATQRAVTINTYQIIDGQALSRGYMLERLDEITTYLTRGIEEQINFIRNPPHFAASEKDIFLDASEHFVRGKEHRKRHEHCVRHISSLLTTDEEKIAIRRLGSCKGIFFIFPDQTLGAVHLWPSPEGIKKFQDNIVRSHPGINFQDVAPVIISSTDRFVSDEIVYEVTPKERYWGPKELGLPAFYKHLGQFFPDLAVDQDLFFADPFVEYCTIEFDRKTGLGIFDSSRVIDTKGGAFFAPRGWTIGEAKLEPIAVAFKRVTTGFESLNQKLRNRGII